MSIQQVKPDPGGLQRQHTRQRRRSIEKKLGAFAVAAAIGLVACSGPGDTPRVENATTPRPAGVRETRAEEVATSFVEAYSAFDAKQAITYVADGADIRGMVSVQGVKGNLKELRLLLSFLEAQSYKQRLNSCEALGSSSAGTTLRCTFDFHAIRSDEIGKGPFSGSFFDLTVRNGEIVRAALAWGIEEFSPQMWEPFAGWVSTAHPEDAAVMYEDETYSGPRLTEQSIRLWEKRSREYVEVKTT